VVLSRDPFNPTVFVRLHHWTPRDELSARIPSSLRYVVPGACVAGPGWLYFEKPALELRER
jgi:hypothetical protein